LAFSPFEHPLALVVATFSIAVVATYIVDQFCLPRATVAAARPQRGALAWIRDFALRAVIVAIVYGFFFAISWRPLYAMSGTFTYFAVFTAISRLKFLFIREPLVFSDVALVDDLLRNREIFYASWVNLTFWVGALGYIFGASALFYQFEPSLLNHDEDALLVLGIAAYVFVLMLPVVYPPFKPWASRHCTRLFGADDAIRLTIRLGAFAYVLYHFLQWLGRVRKPAQAKSAKTQHAVPPSAEKPPVVVVWQSESFVDMRHFGLEDLSMPNLDRLRARSLEWGRLHNIFEGGYTLRTEFSVISGINPVELGPDASHPYLRATAYSDVAWPARLRRAGWATQFIHPYHRRFFRRHKALPALGFDRIVMREEFADPPPDHGPYISDMTLTDRVLSLVQSPTGPQFVFAASIENHGPWMPGRRPGLSDPFDIYMSILERSDEALGALTAGLDGLDRPAWLVFYGDHPPILKSFADPFPDPRTDYVIVPLAAAKRSAKAPKAEEKTPWSLIGDTLRHVELDDASRTLIGLPPPQAGT
jgi:phosphoglycerol transferase MdoB-like AlkP superfamily enzyme